MGLSVGIYELIVIDEVGNEKIVVVFLFVLEFFIVELGWVEFVFSDISEDGKVEVSGNGGILFYKISWDNGVVGFKVENFGFGQYSVIVIDVNGCIVSVDFEIMERVLKELISVVSSGQMIQM